MNFKKTQIKQTIEKILLVAQKNNGYIPISNINDASNFFAYLEGYPSWQAFVKDNVIKKNNFNHFPSVNSLEIKDGVSNETKKIILTAEFAEKILNQVRNKEYSENIVEVKECIDLDKKIILGFNYNKVTKAKDVYFLNKEDTIIFGESEVKNTIFNQFKDNKSSFVSIVSEKSDYLINPINEIFNTKLIDLILKDNQSIFEIMWLEMLNSIIKDFNKDIDIDFLIKSIELEFIVSYLIKNNKYNNGLAKEYLNSIEIFTKEQDVLEINNTSNELHLNSTFRIKELLKNIKTGYEEGIFGNSKERIVNFLNKKIPLKLFVPKNSSDQIYAIFNSVLNFSFKNYDISTQNFKKQNYGVWFICDNKNILKNELFKNIIQIKIFENILDAHLITEEQILFCKLDVFGLPEKDFLIYFYINTKNMDKNIFTEAGKELLSLPCDEFYLWQKANEQFNLNKITI